MVGRRSHAVKKSRKKRKSYAPDMDEHTKAVIEEAIRIRTKMRVRDLTGNERLFRSTILEKGTENKKEAEDSG